VVILLSYCQAPVLAWLSYIMRL